MMVLSTVSVLTVRLMPLFDFVVERTPSAAAGDYPRTVPVPPKSPPKPGHPANSLKLERPFSWALCPLANFLRIIYEYLAVRKENELRISGGPNGPIWANQNVPL